MKQENKKGSIGIIIFALSFIVLNLIIVLTAKGNKYSSLGLSKFILFVITFYTVAYGVSSIIAGINVLRLKEWARKMIIILAVLGIADMFIFIPLNHMDVQKASRSELMGQQLEAAKIRMSAAYDSIAAKENGKISISKEEFINSSVARIEAISRKVMHILMGIMEAFLILYTIILLFFFTRRKVKDQFV